MNKSPNLNERPFPPASRPGKHRRKYIVRDGVMGEVDYDYDRNCEQPGADIDPSEVPHCDRLLGLALGALRREAKRKEAIRRETTDDRRTG